MSYINEADWRRCTGCGQCLSRCPVMRMSEKEAQAAIRGLIQGEEVPRVFDECAYCFNCNRYCPVEGLRPHELILSRTLERRGRVPTLFTYLSNGLDAQNLFSDLYESLTLQENQILDRWSEPPKAAKEILWVGCIGKMSCLDLDRSRVLASLPKFGPRDICCGEIAYRLGSFQMYAQTIEKTLDRFKNLDIERMVCYCGSCYNYLSNILPKVYGKKLPFQLTSLYQWMWEKVEKGELALKSPRRFKAAIHESCYVSELEPEFAETLRLLYAASGVDVVELAHRGDENLSCGAVSIVRNLNPFKSMVKEQMRKYREADQAGVKEIAVNCPGCFITLSFSRPFVGKGLRYMPDELLAAYGDDITRPLSTRMGVIMKSFARRFPGLLLQSLRR